MEINGLYSEARGGTMKFESKGEMYAQQFKQSVSQKRVVCAHHALLKKIFFHLCQSELNR